MILTEKVIHSHQRFGSGDGRGDVGEDWDAGTVRNYSTDFYGFAGDISCEPQLTPVSTIS
jgi:hypothetical protein